MCLLHENDKRLTYEHDVVMTTSDLSILIHGPARGYGDLGGGTDKSPLGQKPTRTKAHWTKAHCLIWQGGQKPTSMKKIGLSLL